MEQTVIRPNITLYKPPKKRFGGCFGLFIETKEGNVLIDGNFPEVPMRQFLNKNKVDFYFVTHFHMDHTAHVHYIEEWTDAKILMPKQEAHIIEDLDNLIEFAGIAAAGLTDAWRDFGNKMLKFKPCKSVEPFTPGETFTFEDITLSTIHLPGHSPGHPGFVISNQSNDEKILHVTDLGLDAFGPWYGFIEICSLPAYFQSIDTVETLSQDCKFLVSSHLDVITQNFASYIDHVRHKIIERDDLILNTLKKHRNPLTVEEMNSLDLVFPISKFTPPQQLLYEFWGENFLKHNLNRLLGLGKITQTKGAYSLVD